MVYRARSEPNRNLPEQQLSAPAVPGRANSGLRAANQPSSSCRFRTRSRPANTQPFIPRDAENRDVPERLGRGI